MILIVALPAFADPLVPREPFAKAHVSLMVRAQMGEREPQGCSRADRAPGTRIRCLRQSANHGLA